MRNSQNLRQFQKGIVIAVTIFATVLGYIPMPDFAQQTQPPPIPKVVSQERISAEEFFKNVNEDPEMLATYKFARGIGYAKYVAALRVVFDDGSTQIIGELATKEKASFEESAWLFRNSFKERNKSLLQQLDKKSVVLFDIAVSTKIVFNQEKVTIYDLQGNILKEFPLKSKNLSRSWFSLPEAYGKHVASPMQCPGTLLDGDLACIARPENQQIIIAHILAWLGLAAALAVCAIPIGGQIECAFGLGLALAALAAAEKALSDMVAACIAEAEDELKLPDLSAKITVTPSRIQKGAGGQVNIEAIFANVAPSDHHTATANFKVEVPILGKQLFLGSLTLPPGQSETKRDSLTDQDLSSLSPGRYEVVAEADTSNAVCEINENKGAKAGSVPPAGSDPNNKATGFFDLLGPRLVVVPPPGFTVKSKEQVILTAGLTDGSKPVFGLLIEWSVPEGTLSSASCTTGSNGQCSVTYTAPRVLPSEVPQGQTGKPIQLTLRSPGGAFYPPSAPVTTSGTIIAARDKSILVVSAEIVDCGKQMGCSQGDTMTLTAQLLYPGAGPPQARVIPRAKIQWTVDPFAVGHIDPIECTSSGDGKCSVIYHHDAISPVSFTVKASFPGNQDYEPSDRVLQGRGALIPPGVPDLTVPSFSPPTVRTRLESGRLVCDVMGTATIRNIGNGDSGPFAMGVFLDSRSFPETEQDFAELRAGSAATVPILLIGLSAGRHSIEVFADWKNAVKESDESNNRASRLINCGE